MNIVYYDYYVLTKKRVENKWGEEGEGMRRGRWGGGAVRELEDGEGVGWGGKEGKVSHN